MFNNEEQLLASEIDRHVRRHVGFAIYRLPLTNEIKLVVQTSGALFTSNNLTDIDSRDGFVFSPYNLKYMPLVVVSPDQTATGMSEIIDTLHNLPILPAELPVPGLRVHNMNRAEYADAFSKFKTHIHNGEADKLVLSRSHKMTADFSAGKFFVEACRNYPRMMIYVFFTPLTGLWAGSTPESLVDGQDGKWTTMALAGTQLYTENPVWDKKNETEQKVVETYISEALDKLGATITKGEAHTVRAAHLIHLRTDFEFELPKEIGIGTIASHLHPTPAICGRPLKAARQFIDNDEPTTRLYYSGIVGWASNRSGEKSHLFVNLRCLTAANEVVTLYAGGGIIEASDEDTEWTETEMKMDTMRRIIEH
ncbi:MAG: chorismate-binding protein [Bacteroidales bacterium]|nr:chorismate-binding protein [Bacteroidales bacterium]